MTVKKLIILFITLTAFLPVKAQEQQLNVYIFVAEECPISIFMAPTLKRMQEAYADKLHFNLVFPFANSTLESAAAFRTQNNLQLFSIKLDPQQKVARKLGASITPEAVVTDAAGNVLYRGRINDAYSQPGKRKHIFNNNDLADALANICNGRQPAKPWRHAVGCFITETK